MGIPNNKFGHSYSVSNFGRVRNNTTGRLLKRQLKKHGYVIVDLSGKHYKVHRLVASLFVNNSNPIKYNLVNHIDLDKTNNHYTNLEWCDNEYNLKHAAKNGVFKESSKGENNGRALLKEDDVLDIWINDRDVDYIVNMFNMTELSAKALKNKARWKHLIPKFESMLTEEQKQRLAEKKKDSVSRNKRKLDDECIVEAYIKLQNNVPYKLLKKEYGISDGALYDIKYAKQDYIKKVLKQNKLIN